MLLPQSQANDESRLQALDDLRVLDTEAEAAYDDIAALAAHICGTPIALVSFVDRHRQWNKATAGLTISDMARAHSFCAHAIEVSDALLVIEDATLDARFAANPFVTGDPHLRFYAGAPIVTAAGVALGTVCVIDTRPRQISGAHRDALAKLARQAASLLALRASTREAVVLALERDRLATEADRHQNRSDQLLDLVLRGGDLGLWDLDVASGRWTINTRERAMLGYSADEAQPGRLDWKGLFHPDDWRAYSIEFNRHLLGRTPFCEFVHRMRHRDGPWIWVMSRSVAVERDATGRPLRVVGTHMDVTAKRQAEEERRENGERLELALSGGDIGLWDLDLRTGRATYNAQWWAMFGYVVDEIEAVDGLWRSMVHPEDYDSARTGLARHIYGEIPMYEGEVRVRHKDGRWLWIQNRAKVVERGPDGAALRIVGVNLNISELKHKQLLLDALAREDALTGLPNRRSFEERVCDAMARSRRSRTPLCLMYLDVDNFKHINDSHGHAGGDAVLKEFARRIKRGVRTSDMVARYAGDEFVLLLEDVAGEEAAAIAARRILAALKPVFGIPGGALRVTTSIGVALSVIDDEDLPALLARADAALYAAKKGGRNGFRMAGSEFNAVGDV